MEEFKSCNEKSRRLLEDMIALNGQDEAIAMTPEWVKKAQAMLRRVSMIMADPGFAEIRSSAQVHQYRSELLHLKVNLERGQQYLLLKRKAIQAERDRIKRLGSLAGTLRAIQ